MTYREFYEHVVAGNLTEEDVKFAEEAILKLDHTNELRRTATAKKNAEKEVARDELRAAIMEIMTAEPKTATTLIAESGIEVKPQAIPSIMKRLVEAGLVVKVDMKVKGKGTQKGYALPN